MLPANTGAGNAPVQLIDVCSAPAPIAASACTPVAADPPDIVVGYAERVGPTEPSAWTVNVRSATGAHE